MEQFQQMGGSAESVEDGDPQDVAEYAPDILLRMLEDEDKHAHCPDHLTSQPVDKNSRAALVDWLVDVHLKLRHRSETLFLAVDVIDRYLSLVPVTRGKLQLVGV